MTARVEFDGEQREHGRYRRHHRDAGYDAPRARFLPVAARESIFGERLMSLVLIVGEEKRHRLVCRQLLRQRFRPIILQRKGLLVLRLLVLGSLILRLLILRLRLVSELLSQLRVSRLIGFIQSRIADGFVEPVERIS